MGEPAAAGAATSERDVPLLGPPAPSSFEPVVTALINEVADQPDADEALLLVLDDYHVISSQLVHSSLGFLLEHRPPGLQLALTSRSDPPLALARLRACGQLTELRAAELRFTPGEAAVLLAQVAAAPGGARPGAPLPDAVAAALAARTEGWAARLQLAGLSLRGRSDVAGFVAAFTGSHRYVLDYLAEGVLEHQGEQVRGLEASARTCGQALEMTAVPGRAPPPAAGPAYVGLGEVAYQRNELDTALRHITEGITLCRQFAYLPPLATGLVTLAWIRQASGDPGGALAAIAEAMQASPGPAGPLNPAPAQRARLLLAQGDLAAAARWTQENGLSQDDAPDYPSEQAHLALARVLLAQDRAGPALALLDRMHAAAAAQDRTGSLIEIGALRALGLAARGDADRAVDALAAALTLACPQGYVRVFADEGPPMAALLARLITAQRSGGAAAERRFGTLVPPPPAEIPPGMSTFG